MEPKGAKGAISLRLLVVEMAEEAGSLWVENKCWEEDDSAGMEL